MARDNSLSILITCDNTTYSPEFKSEWGFSCVIKGIEKTILFDTGADSSILLYNFKKLSLNPKDIDVIVLSHSHWDHVGGLWGILAENSDIDVYVPASFSGGFKAKVKEYGARIIEVDGFTQLFEGVYSTGQLGNGIKEQALVVKSGEGIVVITGCAHPGIVNILEHTKKNLAKEDIHLVIGGFHLMGMDKNAISSIINSFKRLGVKRVGPCHCTGEEAIEAFRVSYKDNFLRLGAGKEIKIP